VERLCYANACNGVVYAATAAVIQRIASAADFSKKSLSPGKTFEPTLAFENPGGSLKDEERFRIF
jgi:hypothetical protein